jgi:hypothetical protein
MFDPTQLFSLTDDQQKQSDAVEAIIDEHIAAVHDETGATEFVFKTSDISKSIKPDHGGLSTKVRTHLIEKFKEAKWNVKHDEDAGTITLKAKRPRKPNAKKPETASTDSK